MMVFLSVVSFLNLPMHTARIPPVDPTPATTAAVLAMHAGRGLFELQ